MGYLIFADVSLDIDMEFARENDVRFVPMEYLLGEEVFHCTQPESDEMMHEFYEKLRKKIPTQTSQITPNHYIDIFEPLAKEGHDILYISLSSGLSNTYESALLAVQNLKEDYDTVSIEIVDSLSATGGMGLLVETAVANRKAGMSVSDNAADVRDHANHLKHWFMVEDLMYLKRGGRVSAATAVMGTALNIKPILTITADGKLDTIDKKRGTRMAIKYMLDRFEATYDSAYGTTVYISGADCREEEENLKSQLLLKYPELTVKMTMLSPIIGAHTGPDMLALIHYGISK